MFHVSGRYSKVLLLSIAPYMEEVSYNYILDQVKICGQTHTEKIWLPLWYTG